MIPASKFRDRLLARLSAAERSAPGIRLVQLSGQQHAQQEKYYELLRRWNRRINLTALALDPPDDRTLDRLFVEPLSCAALFSPPGLRWTDLGSGGGSPAIPLKIACPLVNLVMVESRSRKAAFLSEAVRDLALTDTEIVPTRAEALVPSRNRTADIVTIRAVRIDARLVETAGALLKPGGRLLIFSSAAASPTLPRFSLVEVLPLPAGGRAEVWERSTLFGDKHPSDFA